MEYPRVKVFRFSTNIRCRNSEKIKWGLYYYQGRSQRGGHGECPPVMDWKKNFSP